MTEKTKKLFSSTSFGSDMPTYAVSAKKKIGFKDGN